MFAVSVQKTLKRKDFNLLTLLNLLRMCFPGLGLSGLCSIFVNSLLFFQVLLAVGRDSCTRTIGLETVGVKINEK